ncbi:MAG: ComEA family DNA-binding protein [Acidimicrobiia bacterium]|nr:ComEA family DNA-binding protein [Acidimicrobiia bacterium]
MADSWEHLKRRVESVSWRAVAGAAAIVLVAVGGCLALRSEERAAAIVLPRASPVPPLTSAPAVPEPTGAVIVVHAAGAVARPGVYRLVPTARVVDLLEAAGGLDSAADLSGINLAAPLADGARVHFPRSGEDPPAEVPIVEAPTEQPGTGSDAEVSAVLVDLNEAGAAELESLPGIGPVTAAAIIAHRQRDGPFRSVESLQEVTGIGPVKLSRIQDLVTVTR